MGFYSAIRKNGIIPFGTTWMQVEIIVISKSEEDKGHTISLMYRI